MFSNTDPENSAASWNTTPVVARSFSTSNSDSSSPHTRNRPRVMGYSPSSRFTMVDLPPPDSPTSAMVSPSRAVKLTL